MYLKKLVDHKSAVYYVKLQFRIQQHEIAMEAARAYLSTYAKFMYHGDKDLAGMQGGYLNFKKEIADRSRLDVNNLVTVTILNFCL